MTNLYDRKAELIIGNNKWNYPDLYMGYDIILIMIQSLTYLK